MATKMVPKTDIAMAPLVEVPTLVEATEAETEEMEATLGVVKLPVKVAAAKAVLVWVTMAALVAVELREVTRAAELAWVVVMAKVFATSKLAVDSSRTEADNRRAEVRVRVDRATSASTTLVRALAKPVREANT